MDLITESDRAVRAVHSCNSWISYHLFFEDISLGYGRKSIFLSLYLMTLQKQKKGNYMQHLSSDFILNFKFQWLPMELKTAFIMFLVIARIISF